MSAQRPTSSAVVVPAGTESTETVTALDGSAVPAMTGVAVVTFARLTGDDTTGVAGGMESTAKLRSVESSLALRAASTAWTTTW